VKAQAPAAAASSADRAAFAVSSASSEPVAVSHRSTDFLALTKPRLNLLVLMTTLGGIYLAAPDGVPINLLVHTVLGTALVAGGAAALNQVWERKTDRLMRRTASRPIPGGRLGATESTWFGVALSAIGLAELAFAVNLMSAWVAGVTLISYVLMYTPLKKRTSLSTLVGAIPGALPPVIGWTAVHGSISLPAIVLFGIIFFWQMPHFLAIAWMYRADYARAGIQMLPAVDPDGRRTSQQALLYSAGLWPVSLMPLVVGLAGPFYGAIATILGLLFIWLCFRFTQERSHQNARRLFLFSITYLAVLWAALVFDRVWL